MEEGDCPGSGRDGSWGRLPGGGAILPGVQNRRRRHTDKGAKVPGVFWGRGEDSGAEGMERKVSKACVLFGPAYLKPFAVCLGVNSQLAASHWGDLRQVTKPL